MKIDQNNTIFPKKKRQARSMYLSLYRISANCFFPTILF
ncbi:hypothetical protein FEM08_23900 [Flavobacterium gilvum]|nr:hypothetical protein FEM08_23900 [Flavobacterium gilvum]